VKSKAITLGLKVALAIIPVTLLGTGASAATEKVLHSFGANDRDGVEPSSGLVIDLNGNLYGVTETGGGLRVSSCRLHRGHPLRAIAKRERFLAGDDPA
jgi:hypothetical protein